MCIRDSPDVFGTSSPFARAVGAEGLWKSAGATLEGTARAPVYLDQGASVAPGAEVGPHVYLGPGVRVPAGSRLSEAAVLEGSVPAGLLERVVLWKAGRLEAPAGEA